ncbi:hypothetical protein Rhopal_000690-T1 [Rhodotorula paludigena]|uniref:MYND-type domain-containing protein n=1 Tax=Rhodotorula paludigena TaxID=86838 RepID=A0AAV5GDK4_9BASI|nr:hypothetical protein Rhopal_000690-T1 [Rhodotorula paludigena]
MSTTSVQPCAVCGEKTVKCCSECAKAGVDLYFCSSAHQKLVWSTHREVCGPGKANPFLPAPLSAQELEQAIETCRKECAVNSNNYGGLQLPVEDLDKASRDGKILKLCHEVAEPKLRTQLAQTLTMIRSSLYEDAQSTCDITALLESPFDAVEYIASLTTNAAFFESPLTEAVVNGFRHRLLIFVTLVQLKLRQKRPAGYTPDLIERSYRAAIQFVAPHAVFESPQVMQIFLGAFGTICKSVHYMAHGMMLSKDGKQIVDVVSV